MNKINLWNPRAMIKKQRTELEAKGFEFCYNENGYAMYWSPLEKAEFRDYNVSECPVCKQIMIVHNDTNMCLSCELKNIGDVK